MKHDIFDEAYLQRLKNKDRATEEHFKQYFEAALETELRLLEAPRLGKSASQKAKQAIQQRRNEIIHKIRNEIIPHVLLGISERGSANNPAELNQLFESAVIQVSSALNATYSEFLEKDLPNSKNNPTAFTITFDPELSPQQIKHTLTALADYYRVCGGVGLRVEFELEEALTVELAYV